MLPQLMFNETEMLAFALVLLRVASFVMTWPVFSVYQVPQLLKVLFAVVLAMVLFPVINRSGLQDQGFEQNLPWLACKEVLVGLCLGFLTRLFFFAVGMGGNLIATAAGLANAQIFNPAMGATTTVVEQFYVTVATLLFLALNGHHFFITGLAQSFDAIPLSAAGLNLAPMGDSGLILASVMEAGVKMSAPVMVALFMVNIAMGIVGRAVPQINVLATSMPVNFMAGLLVMLIAIPALLLQLDHDLVMFAETMFKFMRSM